MIRATNRILVTGHRGYIGAVMVPMLCRRGFDVVGMDVGWFDDCDWGHVTPVSELRMDIRDVQADHLVDFDAVVHLAGISNDPLGDFRPEITYEINHLAAVELAKLAREAGVARFLFASSCSVYGAGGDQLLTETSPTAPRTPYAVSKLRAEQEILALANDNFSPTSLRCATAYGDSPRLRGDLVVNNLVGYACATGVIHLKSDGSAWRPLVHLEDICRAYLAVLSAERRKIHQQTFNVGRRGANYQIRDVAQVIQDAFPDADITMEDDPPTDTRCYNVCCEKMHASLPAYRPRWTLVQGVLQLKAAYVAKKLVPADLHGPRLQRLEQIKKDQMEGRLDSSLRLATANDRSKATVSEGDYCLRTTCRNCDGPLRTVHEFGMQPLADAFLDAASSPKGDRKFPLTWTRCTKCSLIQLQESVDPQVLFDDDYPYYSSVSQSWVDHCASNADELIEDYQLDSTSLVVELAANDGYMLENFRQHGIPILGIDPAPGPVAAARDRGIPMKQAFFGNALANDLVKQGLQADVLIANNVLAHVANLDGFVRGIAKLLKRDGMAVIEVPYVADLIAGNQFDTIYHEHLCYFSTRTLCDLFARRRMLVVDALRLPTHGGSLRVFVRHDGFVTPELEQLLAEEEDAGLHRPEAAESFSRQTAARQQELRQAVAEYQNAGRRMAAYGAAAKGTMLLNMCRIPWNAFEFVVDANAAKHGKRMPGSNLPIFAPEKLMEEQVDVVLLLAWNLAEEIIALQSSFLERGGQFLLPIPGCPTVDRNSLAIGECLKLDA